MAGKTGREKNCVKRMILMYWQELTEEQKQEEYQKYIYEVRTKRTEEVPMSYADFCKEWDDCKTIRVN